MANQPRLDQPRGVRRFARSEAAVRLRLPPTERDLFGRFAERIARFSGTATFLLLMTIVIVIWLLWNTLAPRAWQFDPYTFTFLTLLLSLQASYAAPFILLAQNRQADRDRVGLEEDRQRAAAAKADTEYLAREIAALRIALSDVATRDFVRAELKRLLQEQTRAESDSRLAEDERREEWQREERRAKKQERADRRAAEERYRDSIRTDTPSSR